MGADLYIKEMDRGEQITGFATKVNAGYFRDCYNDGGLFNFLRSNTDREWSWWQLAQDKKYAREDKDEGMVMTIKGAEKFLSEVLEAQKDIKEKKKLVLGVVDYSDKTRKFGDPIKYNYEKMNKDRVSEYMSWLQELIDFLQLAITKNSEIILSV